ncbi:MAG TPA: hypothetical protein ENG33_06540 [Chloroflexi bacterium]|nr:hypothetical protein [Chloroflexota bacterium]
MGKASSLPGRLWSAFKNVAIVFSFIVNLILLIVLLIGAYVLITIGPELKKGTVQPMVRQALTELDNLEDATISLTVPISETIPIRFDLPVYARTNVVTTGPVPVSTGANFILPGGGGSIKGTVNLVLPTGLQLPVELYIVVPVSQTVPVRMEVPVSIHLKETELGEIISRLRGQLIEPLTKPLLGE